MVYRVLIVDDQTISRQLFESFVLRSARYEVAASIESAKLADAYCAAHRIDLAMIDVVMKDGSNGLDAAARIRSSYPQIKIIVVTSMPDAMFLRRAREIGVEGFWYKEIQELPMLELMDRVMAGERVFPDNPPVTQIGLAKSTEFTERELDTLRLLVQGMTDREIAERLYISISTVRYHVNNLISKTGQSSRTELAVNAIRCGIVIPLTEER